MSGKPFHELLGNLRILETRGDLTTSVRGIAYDSRDVEPGFLFVAMDGQHTDGHRYIGQAIQRGAAAILHSRTLEPPQGIACARVESPRAVLAPIAAAFYGQPSRELAVLGVTGTDGKSSTVWFITQMLGLLGKEVGFLSTVSFQTGNEVVKNPFRQSTPEATEIQGMLRQMVEAGKQIAVVEATSHGLSSRTNRLGDVLFDAAVLTNVTHEHLEFHGSFEQYRSDKANLFRSLSSQVRKPGQYPRFGVVNEDDPSSEYFRKCTTAPVRGFSMKAAPGADLAGKILEMDITGTTLVLSRAGAQVEARLRIPGPFWAENALAASLAVSGLLAMDPLSLAPLFETLTSVRGRMDYVDHGQPFAVIVDYAHTPGAFEKLFPWVRGHTRGRITAVFGSAGERDPAKRPMQGRIAAEHCDTVIVTDEDPRGEDSMDILEQIAAGCSNKKRGKDLFLVPDRREAIRMAVSSASPGDVLLLLGKGHEGSIIYAAGPQEWDERSEAEAALRLAGYGA